MKRFIQYLIWSLFFIFILYLGTKVQYQLKEYSSQYYKLTAYIIFIWLFPILLGMIIRLPKLVNDIINKKKWSIDWIKLLAVGVPFLYISLATLTYLKLPIIYPDFVIRMIINDLMATKIPGVILGYIILDSLKEK